MTEKLDNKHEMAYLRLDKFDVRVLVGVHATAVDDVVLLIYSREPFTRRTSRRLDDTRR